MTILSATAAVAATPAESASVADDVMNSLQSTLQQRYPDVKIEGVQASPISGLYEVFAGGRVVYADKTGDYLVLGKLVDTKTRHDLSAEHLDIHNAIDFQKLPFDRAIKIVKGDGHRRLAVFADPDCPYCQQLEKEMRSITDVTVYVFLFPLNDVHPNATAHARAIWCSPDRSSAWTDWMVDHKQPSGSTCDGDPLTDIQTLAASLRISSTPTLFLESGRRIGSALPADQLQTLLGGAPAAVVAAPAANAPRAGASGGSGAGAAAGGD